jgi:hypothetical protein
VFRLKRRRVGWVERGETHPPMTGYHDFSSIRPRHTKAHESSGGDAAHGPLPAALLRWSTDRKTAAAGLVAADERI